MPNLFVHIIVALAVSELLSVKQKSILLLGAILPDVRVFVYPIIALVWGLPAAEAFIIPIDSFVGALLLASFLSSLFSGKKQGKIFVLLALGVLIHFLLDAMMFPFSGIEHYLLLFPFSWSVVGVSLSWVFDYLVAFSLLIIGLNRARRYFLA